MGLGSKLRASPPVGSKARGKSIEQKVVQYCWATAPEGAQPGTVLREGEQVPGHAFGARSGHEKSEKQKC